MTYLRSSPARVKPAMCPVDGLIFYAAPETGKSNTGGKTCPHCRSVFTRVTVREMHRAAEQKKLPEFGRPVLVFGRLLFASEATWLQGHLTPENGWRTGENAVPINDVTGWTELPQYAVTVES